MVAMAPMVPPSSTEYVLGIDVDPFSPVSASMSCKRLLEGLGCVDPGPVLTFQVLQKTAQLKKASAEKLNV